MQCPKCQQENQSFARFCIFCGSPLQPSEAAPAAQPPPADSVAQVPALRDEVRRLAESLQAVNKRLAALERPQRVCPVEQAPPLPQPAAAQPELAPAMRVVPVAVEGPVPIYEVRPVEPRPRRERPSKPSEWELILGGNWLARIGVIALIIGIAFLIKFAADNEWINPTSWVILGIVAGLAMLGGGYYWQKRYPALSQALSGGGIALLYLSIFAAFAIFRFLPLYAAVVILFLISVASAGLAIKYNSMALAIIGIIGAFAAPVVLGVNVGQGFRTSPAGTGIQLLVYVGAVDLGVLALASLRNWRWFTLIALFGSLIAFAAWNAEFGQNAGLLLTELSLTVIFLIFVVATTLYHIIWRRTAQGFDYALMLINAVAYYGASFGIMGYALRAWMGGFSLLLALFYGALAYASFRRGPENRQLSLFALGIAIVFFTIAVPVQIGDRAWTTIAWAVEGVVLLWLSFILRLPVLHIFSYAVFAVTTVRLLFFDTPVNVRTFQPVVNQRFLAFLFGIAAAYAAAILLRRNKQALPEWYLHTAIFYGVASFLTVWLLSFEAWDYFGSRLAALPAAGRFAPEGIAIRSQQNLSLTVVWVIYAVGLLVVGIVKRSRILRLGALALLLIAIIKVFAYDVWVLQLVYRIIALVGLGILLLVSAYLYQRYGQVIRGFLVKG